MSGRVKHKAANLLTKATGVLVEADSIRGNHPMHIKYLGVCSWCVSGTRPATDDQPAQRVHLYSWDSLTRCLRHGISFTEYEGGREIEVSSNE